MKIMLYGFGNTSLFFRKLILESRNDTLIDYSIVLPRWHYRDYMKEVLPDDKILYLYKDFKYHYDRYDRHTNEYTFQFNTKSENEYSCLLKDKNGYRKLTGQEQTKRSAVITYIYRSFIEKINPDFILFPDLEVVDGFLLKSICDTLGIKAIHYTHMRHLGGGFFSPDGNESLPKYFGNYSVYDLERADAFISNFRINYEKKEGSATTSIVVHNDNIENYRIQPFYIRSIKSSIMHLKWEQLYAGEDSFAQRIASNFRFIVSTYREFYYSLFQKKFFNKKYQNMVNWPNFFGLYALQYTPESSINSLEPFYIEQLRAIDALLLSMPSDFFLLVKEHPAMVGIRPSQFYRDLIRRPGVILISPHSNTNQLILKSSFVSTITGTIALECFLLDKPCILFGRNFFSHLCYKVESLTKLKDLILTALAKPKQKDDESKVIEIAKLLNIQYNTDLYEPLGNNRVLSNHNVKEFKKSILSHIDRLTSF
jgi:hypothetical protein